MTVKAYITAAMNKFTYVLFHKVGWEQLSGKVGNVVALLLQIYFSNLHVKNYQNTMWFDKVIAKIIG